MPLNQRKKKNQFQKLSRTTLYQCLSRGTISAPHLVAIYYVATIYFISLAFHADNIRTGCNRKIRIKRLLKRGVCALLTSSSKGYVYVITIGFTHRKSTNMLSTDQLHKQQKLIVSYTLNERKVKLFKKSNISLDSIHNH